MAFLLLLHEKMRLKRQVNKLTLKQLRYGNRLDRMTKNISRVQKMYSSKMTQLEKQAQMMQSQASVFFRNQMGLGMDNQAFNPWNMSGGGITSFVLNQMGGMLASGQIQKIKITNSLQWIRLSSKKCFKITILAAWDNTKMQMVILKKANMALMVSSRRMK